MNNEAKKKSSGNTSYEENNKELSDEDKDIWKSMEEKGVWTPILKYV